MLSGFNVEDHGLEDDDEDEDEDDAEAIAPADVCFAADLEVR